MFLAMLRFLFFLFYRSDVLVLLYSLLFFLGEPTEISGVKRVVQEKMPEV